MNLLADWFYFWLGSTTLGIIGLAIVAGTMFLSWVFSPE